MRETVAVVGAVVVFFLTILIWGVVVGFLPQFPQPAVPVPPVAFNPILTNLQLPGTLRTDNVVGLLLALLAALSSYRVSSLRGRTEGTPVTVPPTDSRTRP